MHDVALCLGDMCVLQALAVPTYRMLACCAPACVTCAGGGVIDLEAASGGESFRQRVVAFAEGAGGALADDDKQRLRAANIQDSVVIIRSKMASGQLHSHHLGDEDSHGSEHSWCSDALPGSAEGSHTAVPAVLDAQDPVQQPASHAAVPEVDAAEPCSALRPSHLQHSPSKRVQFLGAA